MLHSIRQSTPVYAVQDQRDGETRVALGAKIPFLEETGQRHFLTVPMKVPLEDSVSITNQMQGWREEEPPQGQNLSAELSQGLVSDKVTPSFPEELRKNQDRNALVVMWLEIEEAMAKEMLEGHL